MANTKKITKREMFESLKAKYPFTKDEVAFIDHELELLAKKNSAEKKPTATQVANKAIAEAIVKGMEPNRYYTITELIKVIPACADLTNQKVSAIVRGMLDVSVRKVEDKRKSYFVKIEG